MKKRIISIALCLSLAASLVACGSSGGTQTEASTTPSDEISIVDDGTEKTITYWHTYTEGVRKDYIEALAQAYMDEHPNVTINVEAYSWSVFTQKWTAGLATGNLPDISSVNPENLYAINQTGSALSMDPLVEGMGEDFFLSQPIDNFTIDGSVMGIPYYLHSYVLWYREDVLEENGIDVPTNWDELLEAAEAVTDAPNQYGFTIAMSTNDSMSAQLLSCFTKAQGAALITEDNKGNLTDPDVMEALELMADLYRVSSPEGSINFGLTEQNDVFYQGKSTFAFGSGFHISGVEGSAPDLIDDIAAVPFFGPDGENVDNTAWVIGIMGWNNTDYPETVYDFINFHFDDERYIDFLHLIPGGMLPATTSVSESEEFWNEPTIQKFETEIQYVLDGVESGTFIGMDYGLTAAAAALTSQGIVEECLQDMILNGTPVEEAAAKANDKLNEAIEILMS